MARPKVKDARINIKTTHELKEAAEQTASNEGRTLTEYLENLIIQDVEKKRVD